MGNQELGSAEKNRRPGHITALLAKAQTEYLLGLLDNRTAKVTFSVDLYTVYTTIHCIAF